MIELKNINKSFKVDFWDEPFKALDNLSFQIKEGSITGYLGANGSGKTTSLKILMGFIPLDSGEIIFSSTLGKNRNEILSNIGYLPERPYFYPHLTGRELVFYMGKLNRVPLAEIKKRMEKWAKRFKVDFALDRKIQTYSKGMLQRIGFVATLIHDPKLIILDEPLSGLDPVGRKEIKDVIVELAEMGKTIFFSSHIVHDVEEICESVIFIEKGQMIYEGSIEKLLADNASQEYFLRTSYTENKNLDGLGEFIRELKGQYSYFKVSKENQFKVTEFLRENNLDLYSLSTKSPTLEEILYKVRGQS